MSSIACPEAPVQIREAAVSHKEIADACRAIRRGWSSSERECRKTLADMKQVSLLLSTVDLSGVFGKKAG